MLAKLPFLFKQSAWLLALLIITSALPARAQSEAEMQEWQFNFEYSDDLNGYIISPDKNNGFTWDGSEISSLYIPSTRLQDGKPVVALSGFQSLKYLEIIEFESPCQVKYICDNCFKYCTSLGCNEGLTLPETVETIGHYAFYECTRLQSINLGSNLRNIGISAFEKCTSLESITLPKSLKV
ncbi:MAG: leucine-rich repeat domain-containing protein, partial [Muribaculaceae bacterium]